MTLSSAEAEYVALADMICEVKYLRELARGLGFEQTEPTLIYEDNRAAILTAEAECSAGGRLRHVDVKYRFTTEAVRNREVRVRYIPTNLNFSDMMTKALVPKKHREGVDLIINDKDAYRIVAARREMTDDKYEESYFIIQDGERFSLPSYFIIAYNASSSPCVRYAGMLKGEGGDGSASSHRQWAQAR